VSVEQRVRKHFDADAQRFDAIYVDQNKSLLSRWIDQVWRGVVRRRLDLALQTLEPLQGKAVLDVGCGSGRFCVAYAERGAQVVGVDFAARMIELAKDLAQSKGLAERCDFRVGAFPEAVPDGPFDASTAIGFFDYIADPVPIVRRMRELTRQCVIMSFPKAREWRVPVRRLRFWMKGCPLYLYSESQVRDVLSRAGFTRYDWIVLDRDYFVVARP
jgi:2-polyprenyl-3-methyl-5-hydroxy-6-metoxy-1,4-benzoquinol methylase